jgi:hypothetical protein
MAAKASSIPMPMTPRRIRFRLTMQRPFTLTIERQPDARPSLASSKEPRQALARPSGAGITTTTTRNIQRQSATSAHHSAQRTMARVADGFQIFVLPV